MLPNLVCSVAALLFVAQGDGFNRPQKLFHDRATDFSLVKQAFNTVTVAPGDQSWVDDARRAGLKVILEFDYKWEFVAGRDISGKVDAIARQVETNPGTVVGVFVADRLNSWANPSRSRLDAEARPAIPPETMIKYLEATGGIFHRRLRGIPVYVDVSDSQLTCDLPGQTTCRYVLSPSSMWRYENHEVLQRLKASGHVDGFFLADNLQNDDASAQTSAWRTARAAWPKPFVLVPRTAKLSFGDESFPGGAEQAMKQTRAWVEIPLQQGADGVALWGWHIPWADHGVPDVRTWLNKDGRSNPLWEAMKAAFSESSRKPDSMASETRRGPQ
jgi:hypothetical protein